MLDKKREKRGDDKLEPAPSQLFLNTLIQPAGHNPKHNQRHEKFDVFAKHGKETTKKKSTRKEEEVHSAHPTFRLVFFFHCYTKRREREREGEKKERKAP